MSASNTNMEANTVLPPHFDLTGQVTIQNTPEFMGNYSFVYQGILRGNLVAVKIIKPTGEPESMKRKVLRERVVWGSTNHPNIHPFSGYADDPAFGPFGALVSPWSARGDASRFLKENGERMGPTERTNLWKGVIEGVLYLHDQAPPIVHGDLKPGNILINEFGVPMICDFGLARIFLEQGSTGLTTTSEHTGTARYLAPELVRSDITVYPTLASDVYALGCLGLDFIYLQQPFSNHPNNIRGQIFRDLRRGVPPATERPMQAWPSLRIWPTLIQCWNPEPHPRPSAFAAARMLRLTILTLPTSIIKAIAHFVDVTWMPGSRTFSPTWEERCCSLRHLCLVSRAYRECVTPFLYREIRLSLDNPQRILQLISTLDSSIIKPHLSLQESSCYPSCIQFVFLDIADNAIRQSDLAVAIRNLMGRLPGLRLYHIHSNPSFAPTVESSPLTTLTVQQVDLAIFFDHSPILQVLESLQRLVINDCYDSAPSGRPSQQPHPRVYLPNLLEISFYGGVTIEINPFATISTWTMPLLGSLDIRDAEFSSDSLLSDLFTFLPTYGPQLQYLKLKCAYLREQDVSSLLILCGGLRSLDIDGTYSLSTLSLSHAFLEKIRVSSILLLDSLTDNRVDSAIGVLKRLKRRAAMSFPNLIEAEIVLDRLDEAGYPPTTVSFRTGDNVIILRNGNETYTAERWLDSVGSARYRHPWSTWEVD